MYTTDYPFSHHITSCEKPYASLTPIYQTFWHLIGAGPNTFDPLDYDGDYYDSVDKLYSFMMDRRPDAEEAAFTSSSAAAEEVELPPGLDKITSKWRELRLNFRMGMNLELGQHKVTPQIFSSSINTRVSSR